MRHREYGFVRRLFSLKRNPPPGNCTSPPTCPLDIQPDSGDAQASNIPNQFLQTRSSWGDGASASSLRGPSVDTLPPPWRSCHRDTRANGTAILRDNRGGCGWCGDRTRTERLGLAPGVLRYACCSFSKGGITGSCVMIFFFLFLHDGCSGTLSHPGRVLLQGQVR